MRVKSEDLPIQIFKRKLSGERLEQVQKISSCFCPIIFMHHRAVFLFPILFVLPAIGLRAQRADTLSGVTLLSVRPAQPLRSSNISITLNRKSLAGLNSSTVAEAARFLPGIQVKDYGGIGGLKTVSLRSLGANYTTVLYNGMIVSDAQGGQIDLGRFNLINTNAIEYTINSPAVTLAPARAFANAAIINIIPDYEVPNGGVGLKAGIHTGSFGLINPFVSLQLGVSSKTSVHLSGDWEQANGKYRYRDYENGGKYKERTGAAIAEFRAEASLYHKISDSSFLLWQNVAYHSNRGLPGAVILYASPAGDRLKNTSVFSQMQWKTPLSKKLTALLSAKYSKEDKDYTDPDYPNSARKLENFFRQQSLNGSAAFEWKISHRWGIHYAADFIWDALKRIDSFAVNYPNPQRKSLIQNAGVNWAVKNMRLQADLLHNLINETVKTGVDRNNESRLSPSASINVKPGLIPLYLRASFKYIYRFPTFDELYFTNIGNTALRPEIARLYNVGMLGENSFRAGRVKASWSVDGYYQFVTNKILAIPRQNLFQWSMMNVGKAAITGMDAGVFVSVLKRKVILNTGINYSFQQALDLSDPSSVSYRKQLPYAAIHAGTLRAVAEWGRLRTGYNLLFTGERYRAGGELPGDRLSAFTTHDVNVAYQVKMKKSMAMEFKAEANNIFNRQYEIIRYYPMPGFNFRLSLTVTYKNNKSRK
ncbi:MAG: TonB-dependent receptor [Chitinophagaceae bacterium]|nr:TonB-dependent receptor [Chitinophagaceae bacterium]